LRSLSESWSDRIVTVQDVFALPQMIKAGLAVVAGERSLQHEVQWVHAAEIPDIARFLSGGELLLTAGTGIGTSPSEQLGYIDRLIRVGASGLVLELGRHFASVPASVLDRADEAGLPVATLTSEVRFAEIMRDVHERIIGQRYALQAQVERMAIEFNDLLLSGGGTAQILQKLFELTGQSVLLEDSAHQLVDHAGPPEEIETIVDGWSEHSRFGHREPVSRRKEGGVSCAWAPIVLRGEQWGRIHILGDDGVGDAELLAARRASTALGLALLNNRHNAQLAERTRADLLAEVASRAPRDPAAFLRQARSLGADFRRCNLVALHLTGTQAAVETGLERLLGAVQASSGGLLRTQLARDRSSPRGLQALHSEDPGVVRVLLGIPAEKPATEAARSVAEGLIEGIQDSDRVVVGVSRAAGVPAIPRAFHEAAECQRFARVSHGTGVLEYSSLGLHLLLASLVDGPELPTFVETELGFLLDHDAHARSPLLPTLQALLAHDGNRADAARALHIERRSLYYRIQRIESLLGLSLNDHDVKLGLSVALRALSLIEDRAVSLRR
jgi:purine catabolism regulator